MQSEPERNQYPTAIMLSAVCGLLCVDPKDAVARSGLSQEHLSATAGLVSARDYFRLWDAIVFLGDRPDLERCVGIGMANGPVDPIFLALSCAPDLRTGLDRIARYKHLLGPVRYAISDTSSGLGIRILAANLGYDMPVSHSIAQVIFLHQKAQTSVGAGLVPKSVSLPQSAKRTASLSDIFGIAPREGEPEIVYYQKDARRAFISVNTPLWEDFEADLSAQETLLNHDALASDRVRACLIEAISSGDPTINYVCRRLGIGRSTVLKQLQDEGTTFQSVLDSTRRNLALRYLQKSQLSLKQVAMMLAYRDTNAFHRAFKKWTGLTPNAARAVNAAGRMT